MTADAKLDLVTELRSLTKENEDLETKLIEVGVKMDKARTFQGNVERVLGQVINGQANIVDKMSVVQTVFTDVKEKTSRLAMIQNDLKRELVNKIYLQNVVWKEINELRTLLENDKNPMKLIIREFQLAAKELHHMGLIQGELIDNFQQFKRTVHEEMNNIRSQMMEIINFLQDGLSKKVKLEFQSRVKSGSGVKPGNKKPGGQEEVANNKHISQKGFTSSEEEVLEALEKDGHAKSALKTVEEPVGIEQEQELEQKATHAQDQFNALKATVAASAKRSSQEKSVKKGNGKEEAKDGEGSRKSE